MALRSLLFKVRKNRPQYVYCPLFAFQELLICLNCSMMLESLSVTESASR